MKLLQRRPHFISGNKVTLLKSGVEYFPALEAAIDSAQREIFLETYIFADDDTGQRIAVALKRAAQRGVVAHVLLDGFGSKELTPGLIEDLRGAGVQVLYFRPEMPLWKLRRHRLRRLHRKLAVVDGRIAFVGGINIIDDVNTPSQTPPRYDYAVSVEGPLLAVIHRSARRLWALVNWTQLKSYWHRQLLISPVPEKCGDMRAALVVRDNIRHRRDIEQVYLSAINAAESEIIIACAYFLPGTNFRRALIEAVGRGVKVVLLLQGRVEYVLLHYATRALYGTLLDGGVEIYDYHKSFLHAKVAVIDSRWATVGSSNIDPFSLALSREANVVVDNAEFAAELRASLEEAMSSGAQQVHPAQWKQQPFFLRFKCWLAYGVTRFMMGAVGYSTK